MFKNPPHAWGYELVYILTVPCIPNYTFRERKCSFILGFEITTPPKSHHPVEAKG
jgi:hypothetical protein